ncbi:beta-galactosidase 13-like [Pistacia vera]|uniref:beta-galactosidase 13-like n=1 Tax=Pistacia vera TaxID=55513 RepID=UPI001263811F|nr:beta-galactosidase 13-like [Pistacia vera]
MSAAQILVPLLGLFVFLVFSGIADGRSHKKGVTYDGRSLIINGNRELLFSGSVHYPRMPPEMWWDIINKAKDGGLNVIQTYVFWSLHEPVQGQYNFEGNCNLTKFIKTIGDNGMYATLRVGPFIEAEWNYGGLPFWLRDIPNITFRSDNLPFKYHMKKFTKKIIQMMKDEKLFASQGGPIILSQIENEYAETEITYKELGTRYVQWAGTMAVGLHTGVPWIMCKQKDAPDPIINTCNGRNCGDTFSGTNKPNKPVLWTQNWTSQFGIYGDPPSHRRAEDIAYSIARFFSKNGTLANYYMYYGGTNYGRSGSSFVTARYYDEAPIDEYGLLREPKWGHLRDLHSALKKCEKALLWGTPSVENLGEYMEAHIYEDIKSKTCAAFLSNNNSRIPAIVNFRGAKYYLPQHSISILADCKTVAYNTQTIVAQHSSRNYQKSEIGNKDLNWEMSHEHIPTLDNSSIKSVNPLGHWSVTKETTDYLWYTTRIELDRAALPFRKNLLPVIQISSLGHLLHAFVNGEYIGSGHGNNIKKSFVFEKPIILKPGTNHISLLGATVGLPDHGIYLERRYAGVLTVAIEGLNIGTIDVSDNGWGNKIGLDGEKLEVFTQSGSHRVNWTKPTGKGGPLTWYKAYFDCPEGNEPLAINLATMSKGMVWINGKSIGRYWVSYLTPLGNPSQEVYHIPRAFLNPTDNLLVIFEEIEGYIDGVQILTVNRNTICSYITENYLDNVHTAADDAKRSATLSCPDSKRILNVEFASYGNPFGTCGNYFLGNCSSPVSKKFVEKQCLGKSRCDVPFDKKIFDRDGDLCPNIPKYLAIQAVCGEKK